MTEIEGLIERLGAETVVAWKVQKTPSAVWAHSPEPHPFSVGNINTRWGVVGAYQQGGRSPMTILNIVIDGRDVRACWTQKFTERYLKTLANRFAEEAFRTLETSNV